MAKDKDLYIGILNPSEARKSLLETSKDVIRSLQSYEKIRNLRAEEAAQIAKFSSLVHEISVLLEEFRKDLPELDPEELPKPKAALKIKSDEIKTEEPLRASIKPRLSDLQKLDKDLTDIEEKLKRL